MSRALRGALLFLCVTACGESAVIPEALPRELDPVSNPFGPKDSLWSPQPKRLRPATILANEARGELYVALQGTETEPGRQVAIVDAKSLAVLAQVDVGPGPTGLALHPAGRHLVVVQRFASYASVIDLDLRAVTSEVEVPFYTEGVTFDADGERALLVNRWTDSLLRWKVSVEGASFEARVLDPMPDDGTPVGIPLPNNPRRIRYTPDGRYVLVTSETDMTLTLLRSDTLKIVGGYRPNAPVVDAVPIGEFVYVLHTGSGSMHPPDDGFDGDDDGKRGDGTANVAFQDLQNEIDVLALPGLERVHRYTSDSICCRDYRDVDPDRPDYGLELKPIDAWPPERAAFVPPKETWIVAGAMPERAVEIRRPNGEPALAVVFGGSSEVQTFDIDSDDGSLTPRETADTGLYKTGFGATDAVAIDDGRTLVVVDRLSETLTALDLHDIPGQKTRSEVVGDVSDGSFPATDVELGEAFNTVTALFTVDGDQTCVHCHREGTPVAKPISMPLLESPAWGARLVMSYRGAYDSRPWFMEAAMNEENFFPVINEFARRENFCCEQADVRVWSRYPTREACEKQKDLEGCSHVLNCLADPPPECTTRGYGPAALTRDAHFEEAARRVLGTDKSIGDAMYAERIDDDGNVVREPVTLGFTGITRALGMFLLGQSRVLPNPYAVRPSALARIGEKIYHSPEAGCAVCHPLPIGATASATVVTESPGPVAFPFVVSPRRHPDTGANVDRVNPAFLGTFPMSRQDDVSLRIGVPNLRGVWDRSRFLHDGRARSLVSVLATPGHPALSPGEQGFNETDGQPNTHGGTSHLTAEELRALVAFVLTL